MEMSVKNDDQVSDVMDRAWKDATIIKQTTEVSPNINEEELAEIVELTKRKELLEANGGEVAKAELPQVNNRIIEITNAIKERSTAEVDASKSARDSKEVGEGDAEQEVARKDTSEGIQEEEVTVEDQKESGLSVLSSGACRSEFPSRCRVSRGRFICRGGNTLGRARLPRRTQHA